MYLQFLPNIKPVTSIIILTVPMLSLTMALYVATTMTLVSGLLLGITPVVFFQIFAWWLIAIIEKLLVSTRIGRTRVVQLLYVFLSGYIFGIFVSMDQLLYGGWKVYITYWLAGLTFDTLHAIGNVAFYPICKIIMARALEVSKIKK